LYDHNIGKVGDVGTVSVWPYFVTLVNNVPKLPEEVEAYCKKLIDEVGGDGGFIQDSGCSVPYNVKAENFRAMIKTGKNYELSRK